MVVTNSIILAFSSLVALASCSDLPVDQIADRPEYSNQECTDQGGIVTGDIGNGDIFLDEYVCESNGLPPIGNIVPQPGESIPIEGAVCCGSTELLDSGFSARPEVSRQECSDEGGEIVGDIGDGRTRRDDYVCDSNGLPPIANVVPQGDEPIATEGEVCCGPDIAVDRPMLTRQECEEDSSGVVVGDAGDGATRRSDYMCESNGKAPIANILSEQTERTATEGEVCCGDEDKNDVSSAPTFAAWFSLASVSALVLNMIG